MQQTESFDDTIRRLSEVLRDEKNHLLTGAYDSLPQFSALKERYVSYIERCLSEPHADAILREHGHALSMLKKLAAENELLLRSTKNGVKSAQERMAHLNKIDSVVGTYTSTGGQLRLEDSATTCKKIA